MSDVETEEVEVNYTPATTEEVLRYMGNNLRFNQKDMERLQSSAEHGVVAPIVFARALGVRPQMIYNYIKKGKLASCAGLNSTDKIVLELDGALEWASHYVGKKNAKRALIEAQLRGEAGA
jgi:hypothetical protein